MSTNRSRQSNGGAVFTGVILAVLISPPARADEVLYWNDRALDVMRGSAASPAQAGRAMAIVQSAVFDAVNAIEPTHTPIFYQPAVAGPASKEAAVAAAAYTTLVGLYPEYASSLGRTYDDRLTQIRAGATRDYGTALGQDVAQHVLAARASHGSNLSFNYRGGTAPGQWRPTPPVFASGLDPYWGNVTPFVIPSAEAFLPAPPPALSSPAYAEAFNEVKRLGAANSTARTADQTEIVYFWLDSPGATASPVGKWDQVAHILGEQQGNTLAENAGLLALVSLAMADAGIVTWDAKYTYELWRPETAIHLAEEDGNPDTLADPDWTPLLETPGFPEYTSGHSTFGGAAATTMALFFSTDDITFTLGAGFEQLPGVTRTYDSLSAAAFENGRSRIYGGVHFEFADLNGLETGQAIGAYVYHNVAQPIPAPAGAVLVLIGTACVLRWKPHSRPSLASPSARQ